MPEQTNKPTEAREELLARRAQEKGANQATLQREADITNLAYELTRKDPRIPWSEARELAVKSLDAPEPAPVPNAETPASPTDAAPAATEPKADQAKKPVTTKKESK